MKIKNFNPGIFWAALIFAATISPGKYIPEVPSFWERLSPDLIVHLIFFSILGYLWTKGFLIKKKFISFTFLCVLTLFGTIYGIFIECIQFFSNLGRTASAEDAIANFLGFAIGVFFTARPNMKKQMNNNT